VGREVERWRSKTFSPVREKKCEKKKEKVKEREENTHRKKHGPPPCQISGCGIRPCCVRHANPGTGMSLGIGTHARSLGVPNLKKRKEKRKNKKKENHQINQLVQDTLVYKRRSDYSNESGTWRKRHSTSSSLGISRKDFNLCPLTL